MRKDIWKFGIILSIACLFGWSVGQPLLIMLIASIGIIAWQIYRLQLLYLWLNDRKKIPVPDTSGQFHLLHRVINQRSKKNRLRKRQLTNYLKQFRKAASALPNAIVLIDSFSKIIWANNNAETLFEIRRPSDYGVSFAGLMRDQKIEKLLDQDNKHEEVEITSKVNPDISLSIQIVRYTDELRMIIARDISKLVETNKIQSDFVANVSHELKTPLTVLKGYLEIFQNTPDLTPKLIKPLQQMSAQSDRMELIVQDLLYLAKLENKNDNNAAHQPVNITNIINMIVDTVNDRMQQKQLKLELDINYKLEILGSDTELHAAFSNLIFNAVNYTPKHGVINVTWKKETDGTRLFCVKDNGEGIPNNHLPRLTQRFYRIDNDRSRDGGGTGLGLAIVKHVLQRHNARLEIDSQIGVGSEFKCIFPSLKDHQIKPQKISG